MSAAPEPDSAESEEKPKGRGKLLLIAVPVVLLAAGAALWFTGVIPGLLHGKAAEKKPETAEQMAKRAAAPPVYVDVPEIISNLNVPGRRQSYVKLRAKIELGGGEDQAGVTAAMPRIQDLFQTYLRDMRPEELRGSEGTYRLREELVARAAVAVAPAHIRDVLFVEMIIQ